MAHREHADPARRHFLMAAGALGAAASATAADPPAPSPPAESTIPQRPFGKTGVTVSALGMGGHHIGEFRSVDDAIRLIHEAIDGGITFFDNCWEYFNGRTENWMGRALRGRRDKVFLMTKVCTHGRGAAIALEMLDQSLRRLETDHLDLWQVHGVSFDNDPDLAYARGGVLEALDSAKRAGKVRFVGFTGHKDPAIHLRMIRLGYPFDAVQMPLNCCDASFRSFEHVVLPEAQKRGIAVLGMKSLGGMATMVKRGLVTAEQALRYAMSLPVATTISGMDKFEVLHQNLKIARGFKPMSANEMAALRKKCAAEAADGRHEMYKVSLKFDNPEARLPHGFPLDAEQKEVKEAFKAAGSP
jgi:aryl-alcohol dehydrogenase-like predicted oxidoreductase